MGGIEVGREGGVGGVSKLLQNILQLVSNFPTTLN
jgi:hypothetical protein